MRVIGVRFRTAGKLYFFTPREFEVKKGDRVIAETARGIEFGTVVAADMEVAEEKVPQPIKPLIRIANQRDVEQEASNRRKEKEAFKVCLEKIRDHKLEMKLIDVEYTFDNNKVLFYFTADGRIDFRELVKDLASVFKTRIELRQIGVRDETKIVGGIGICGRPLCCHSYLADFIPVSIKMAKEQNLSLNPAKISGVCGRLMCCLKNEEETYEELNRRLPGIGDAVTTEEGLRGEVHSVNVLRQLVKVVVSAGDEKEIREFPVEKLHFRRRHSKKEKMELSKEELQELERLEEEEWRKKEQELADRAQQSARLREAEGRQSGGRRQSPQQPGEGQHPQRAGQRQQSQKSGAGRRAASSLVSGGPASGSRAAGSPIVGGPAAGGRGAGSPGAVGPMVGSPIAGSRAAGALAGSTAGGQRQSFQRTDGFQKHQSQRSDNLQKYQSQHADGFQHKQGQRQQGQRGGHRPQGQRPDTRPQAEQEQAAAQHPGDRKSHDGRRRQDRVRQEGREFSQNGKSHNDNRNRHDGKHGQDRQRGSGGDRP